MANYKSKAGIKRRQLKNNFLKRVIIRFDYTSIVNMQNMLDQIVPYFESLDKSFEAFDRMIASNDDAKRDIVVDSSNNMIERPFVYRFSDCQIDPKQDVALDLAQNYLCLDIRCDMNYSSIDSYLEIMTNLMSIILKNDTFVQVTRMGIRKIDGIDSITPNDADNVFEYFSQQLKWRQSDKMQARQYTDYMSCEDIPAYVTYSRIVRIVPGGNNLRFTLDIDCYKDGSILEKRPSHIVIKESLSKMNEKLFDLFVMGIKLEYINQNL